MGEDFSGRFRNGDFNGEAANNPLTYNRDPSSLEGGVGVGVVISFTGIAIVVVVGAVAVVASGAAVDGDAVDTAAVAGGEEMIA